VYKTLTREFSVEEIRACKTRTYCWAVRGCEGRFTCLIFDMGVVKLVIVPCPYSYWKTGMDTLARETDVYLPFPQKGSNFTELN